MVLNLISDINVKETVGQRKWGIARSTNLSYR